MNDEATRDNVQFLDLSQFPVTKVVGFGMVREDWMSPGKNCAVCGCALSWSAKLHIY